MASSKVMVTAIPPANPDLPRQSTSPSIHFSELQTDPSKNYGSMNMDELLKNIYADPSDDFPAAVDGTAAATGGLASQGSFSLPKSVGNKTVDEVWKDIVSGSCGGGGVENRADPEMTLEDFLTKAGAVREEDVARLSAAPPPTGYVVDSVVGAPQFNMQPAGNAPGNFGVEAVGFGTGNVAVGAPAAGGRGKRRAVEEPPMDRATQQKQRRMIKNRESAARSRERKQAYTVELESLVTQLEEENARLMREEAEQTRVRFKQLMENLIPVVEKRRPTRVLRRMNSL